MVVVVILLVVVAALAAVTVALAIGGQRSRARRGDEVWQEKVAAEYEAPPEHED